MGGVGGWYVLGEEEENEAHAVDDDAEVLEEGGEGLGPEIGNHEADVEFHKTEARNEKRVLWIHDQHEEGGSDGEQTERGDPDEHPACQDEKEGTTWGPSARRE